MLGEFNTEVLCSSYGGPRLSQAVVAPSPGLYINFKAFPECDANLVLILVNLQMFW